MYKRLELHNHTTESDASISPKELVEFMVSDNVDGFAITDHNTISGQKKIREIIENEKIDIGLINGMELTTYYGHILALGITGYIEWEDIDINKPEILFERIREQGGVAGIAHPFSYGAPFARGCRFDMKINDYSRVDYIEISNNPEPLHEVNERGLGLWENLVLNGEKLAATAGMDLHGKWDMSDNFATFIEMQDESDYEKALLEAIKTQRTWVSKGPILEVIKDDANADIINYNIVETGKNGYKMSKDGQYMIVITTNEGNITVKTSQKKGKISIDKNTYKVAVPKLYRGEMTMEDLVCVSPVITRG